MARTRSGWYPDPTGRHQTRWWDGAAWRGWVDGDGDAEVDPAPDTLDAPTPAADPVRWAIIGCAVAACLVIALIVVVVILVARGLNDLDVGPWDKINDSL